MWNVVRTIDDKPSVSFGANAAAVSTAGNSYLAMRLNEYLPTPAQLRRPDLVILVILTINLLSAVDAVLTLNALSRGPRSQPLLRTLMERDPTLWIWAKTAMVAVLSFALWALRRYRMGLIAALFGLGAFTATLMWHIVGSIALFS